MEKLKNVVTTKILPVSAVFASGGAFAADGVSGGNLASIQTAISNGISMVSTTTGGMLSVAAICFGVGVVTSMLIRR